MIDVSQWRASIGLWNYCQAASSRPTNGIYSHSSKASVNKSGSATLEEKTSKLPAALSLMISLLLSYMKINFIPPTGIITVTGTFVSCFQSLLLVIFIATIGSSSDLILVCRLLLLLSGDVELNPGPMIDDQPTCREFTKYLKPLVEWKPFVLCLPGITQFDVNIIDRTKRNAHYKKMAIHKQWLQVNPPASWRDVINALKQCRENELARSIELKVTDPIAGGSSMETLTSNANPGPGNPKVILRTHSDTLTDAITTNVYKVTDALYAEGLIPLDTKEYIQTAQGIADYRKSSQLVSTLQIQLGASLNSKQYLIDICHVLKNQQHGKLTDIANFLLPQLGQSIPDNDHSHTALPSPVDNISLTNIIPDDSANRVGYLSHEIEKKDLKPGDHIYTHRTLYLHSHHGIYIGERDCEVIHFSGDATGSLRNKTSSLCQVRKTTLNEFCDGNALRLVAYNCSTSKKSISFYNCASCHIVKAMALSETVKVAKNFLNHPKKFNEYRIKDNNSETFACFCKTGLDIAAQLHPLRNVFTEWRKGAPCTTYEEAMKNYK